VTAADVYKTERVDHRRRPTDCTKQRFEASADVQPDTRS
jgi:hypothetical protein